MASRRARPETARSRSAIDLGTELTGRLARNVLAYRLKKKLTQYDLALLSGLNIRHVQKAEEGLNATLKTVAKLAKGLGVDPFALMQARGV